MALASSRPPRSSTRSHAATRRTSNILGPSSGILSLLATIAASSSTAGGSPLGQHPPPFFLCPSIGSIEHQPVAGPSRSPKKARRSLKLPPRGVVPKFEPGKDGKYRKASEFVYYGSTVCAGENCSGTGEINPTYAASPSDEDNGTTTTLTPPVSSPASVIMQELPPGWDIKDDTAGQTTLIIVLSMSLAFTIALFMIGCMFWRKQKRRSKGDRDIEMRQRRRRREHLDDESHIIEKEMRVKQKMWARASARWKANTRHSARQRRGRRMSAARHSHSSLSIRETRDSPSSSRTHSRTSSRCSSVGSLHNSTTSPSSNSVPSGNAEASTSARRTITVMITEPPAYNVQRRPSLVVSSPQSTHGSLQQQSENSPARTRRPSASFAQVYPVITDLDPEPYDVSMPASAHVATDDKNLLARLNDLASAPPPGTSADAGVSAPVWQDEEMEDFSSVPTPTQRRRSSVGSCSSEVLSSGLLFPLPPSKGKMPAYDYSYSYEDLSLDAEPEAGPSAPPFEATPSAPPECPSAPPMFGAPSAPLLNEDEDWMEGNDNHEWDVPHTLPSHLHPLHPANIPLPPSPPFNPLALPPDVSSPPGYS